MPFVDIVPPAPTATDRRNDRRRAMLQAAETLFLERGYEAVTLSQVVQRSGGSLATLYAFFGNKAGLLRAVLAPRDDELWFRDRLFDDDVPPARVLARVAADLFAKLTSPRTLRMLRIVMGESLRDPSFAQAFHQQVRLPLIDQLAERLASWTRRGEARVDRPHDAAAQFMGMLLYGYEVFALSGACADEQECALQEEVDWRIAPFISHYRIAG